ncbi:D-alanine--D-alanine ligase [Candidatus Zixiibacteriota bacterium]
MDQRPVAGVLLGGTSPEREVSLASGEAVAAALETEGWHVRRYDYGAGGEDQYGELSARLEHAVTEGPLADAEVVFIVLHGGAGEDGRVQGWFEMAGIPYAGTGVLGSAASMDKWITKSLAREVGIAVPGGVLWHRGEQVAVEVIEADWGARLGWPLVIKPVDGGSTVGLTIAQSVDEVPDALALAGRFSQTVLVEEYIPGREVTVAVLGDDALPVIEIIPSHGIYDYECKYTAGMSSYICPAELPADVTRDLQDAALTMFRALHHRDFSRIDFRMTEDLAFYLLEGNTLPGFTSTSLVPKAAAAAGIEFGELCSRIVGSAINREVALR